MLDKANPSELIVKNINFRIGEKIILKNITLNIPTGRTTGILGPNGAGKTTLLDLFIGLRKPTSGNIQFKDADITVGSQKYRQNIGIIMQETSLYNELTTFENLSFSASLYGLKNSKKRIYEVLDLLSIADRTNDTIKTLSGGLQRRVTIARALIHNPKLLIIDEPTLGVDADTRHIIWSYLRLLKSKGTTIIVATNYLDEALALCDNVSILSKGQLLATNENPEDLIVKVGSCIDISCDNLDIEKKINEINYVKNIIKVDKTPEGISVFFKGEISKDEIIHKIMEIIPVKGFKFRAPDLSEVFRFLENEKL